MESHEAWHLARERLSRSVRTSYDAAAQRRNLNSPARECRESVPDTGGVRFSGRHEFCHVGQRQDLANTDFVAERVIQLPFFNEITKGEIREVCKALKHAIQDVRRNT